MYKLDRSVQSIIYCALYSSGNTEQGIVEIVDSGGGEREREGEDARGESRTVLLYSLENGRKSGKLFIINK
jgi:hypothetical protein